MDYNKLEGDCNSDFVDSDSDDYDEDDWRNKPLDYRKVLSPKTWKQIDRSGTLWKRFVWRAVAVSFALTNTKQISSRQGESSRKAYRHQESENLEILC